MIRPLSVVVMLLQSAYSEQRTFTIILDAQIALLTLPYINQRLADHTDNGNREKRNLVLPLEEVF